ncbi:MarR family winged helix-turn-helix transcriptional regulator [Pacificibacter marinus]|uniref:MarR family protein n=1 Tax=Pacificibacter marinus TaxID=658057 RepID=A0A1Y5RWV5_9RHOB|nr:MarR family winged helix-turn-helix transcriptional regulator [Pacificibacter marinus]SEK37099.1 transcriptional regulator, MarR family [Pacificibacter marinus]SLN26342.1 MarR family protein [Pacificibacter marinus]
MPYPPKDWSHFFGDDDPKIGYNRLWFFLMRAHRKIYPKISKVLRDEGMSDPIWYEILMYVEKAGDAGQPMASLENELYVPQYALSRHISRMEKAGYIRRTYLSDGRRKQVLFITEDGKGIHGRIWPAYLDAIQTEFSEKLTTDEAYDLAHKMVKLFVQGESEQPAP